MTTHRDDSLKRAAQAGINALGVEVEPYEREHVKFSQEFVEAVCRVGARVLLVGGDNRVAAAGWPERWVVTHRMPSEKSYFSALKTAAYDCVISFDRWQSKEGRAALRTCKLPSHVWLRGVGDCVKLMNTLLEANIKNTIEDVPPSIYKAKSVRELLRVAQPSIEKGHVTIEEFIKLAAVYVKRDLVLCLRGKTVEQARELLWSTWRSIEEQDRQVAEERERKLQERATPPATPTPVVQESVVTKKEQHAPPKKAEAPPELRAIESIANNKRSDSWGHEELENLITAWDDCEGDADRLVENFKILNEPRVRTASSVLFALQRILLASGKPLPEKTFKRLKELALADRSKKSLAILELIEKQGDTTLTTHNTSQKRRGRPPTPCLIPPAPEQRVRPNPEPADDELLEDPSLGNINAPEVKMRALVAYEIAGVRLGVKTERQALAAIALLVGEEL